MRVLHGNLHVNMRVFVALHQGDNIQNAIVCVGV